MKKRNGPSAWSRFCRDRSFYFVYQLDRPHTYKLIETGQYGVVQLTCIKNEARTAFMAGFRAGKRSASKLEDAP